MVTVLPRPPLSVGSVDDVLGAREGRFFGEGFKRVTHHLTDISVIPVGTGGRVDATAGIQIPAAWSRKGEIDQRPHLSTVDVMIFGAQLAGLYLAHSHGVAAAGPFGIRSLAIRAGTTPQEDGLDRFPVSARHLKTSAVLGGPNITKMDCQVGSLAIQIEAEHHGVAATERVDGHYTSATELPGPWNSAPYGMAHHSRRQLLSAVEADLSRLAASAALTVVDDADEAHGSGRRPTFIDLFVSALQLGQVLLYTLDDVDRTSSSTLWMRRTSIQPAPSRAEERFEVRLQGATLLPTEQGTWRSAQIVTTHGGQHLRCLVAHQLPKGTR
jgi:hypothetical protein